MAEKSASRRQRAGRSRDAENTSLSQLSALADRISHEVQGATVDTRMSPREAGFDETPLPLPLLAVLSQAMYALANGEHPRLVVLSEEDEMTTAQAADVLGVSRPHLVQLLKTHQVPFRRVGDSPTAHRRIRSRDVLALKERRAESHAAVDELMKLSEDIAD